uniref:Craniofacial development protein 2-like n=2 Tax=Nicotiana TaxID=4085 RepID=A0A1S4BLW1_TOBAC|nr:PREDICTED: uncharacterized protein LOC104223631 [Nicotiana sylvestris]XP_016489827.1 PREDICTED: uncharacterized protein LOC107809684 [Nicotiana tabacum]
MPSGRPGGGGKGGKGVKGSSRLRVGSWNIGSLTGKSIELGNILHKREINIACAQETRWKGTRARDVNGFKLWYSGGGTYKNWIGILVDMDLKKMVVDARRVNDRVMSIKLVVDGVTFNVISAYTPQVGLGEEVKRHF